MLLAEAILFLPMMVQEWNWFTVKLEVCLLLVESLLFPPIILQGGTVCISWTKRSDFPLAESILCNPIILQGGAVYREARGLLFWAEQADGGLSPAGQERSQQVKDDGQEGSCRRGGGQVGMTRNALNLGKVLQIIKVIIHTLSEVYISIHKGPTL